MPTQILGYLMDSLKRTNPRYFGSLLLAFSVAAAFYANSVFATKGEVQADFAVINARQIPMRVDRLEVFATEHKAEQVKMETQFDRMREDIATIKAVQQDDRRNWERVFNKLDRMSGK